jgi:hypothetical protein
MEKEKMANVPQPVSLSILSSSKKKKKRSQEKCLQYAVSRLQKKSA